jgi:hypothetical protein
MRTQFIDDMEILLWADMEAYGVQAREKSKEFNHQEF